MTTSAVLLNMRNDVLQLIPGSFGISGHPTALFVPALLRGLGNKAAKLRILGLWYTAEECAELGIQQVQIIQEPEVPANAAANALKVYEIMNARWKEQSTAIEELKSLAYEAGTITVKDRLDERINGVNFGIMRLTLTELKTRISTIFGQSSIQDLATYRAYLDQQWTPDADFPEFLAQFNDIIQFLQGANQPMPSGEAVLKLIAAVKHAPSFSIATQLFFTRYAQPAEQTLEHLMTEYRQHYATSYSDISARGMGMGMAHQIVDAKSDNHAPLLTLIMNEVRQHTGPSALPLHTQQLVLAAVRSALQMPTSVSSAGSKRPTANKGSHQPCPEHPNGTHSWQVCRKNPKNIKDQQKDQSAK